MRPLFFYMSAAMDNKDLQTFLAATKVFFEYLDGQSVVVLNTELQVSYVSDSFADIFAVKLGDYFCANNSTLHQMLDIDKFAIAIQNTLNDRIKRQLCMPLLINGRIQLQNLYLTPAIANNKVIGVVIYVIRFNPLSRIEMVLQSIGNTVSKPELVEPVVHKITYSNKEESIKLTPREENVVFLLILNFTSREIAAILSQVENKKVSKDAIDKLISNQLQIKFNVVYRYKLVERLIELGYHKMIPEVFAGKFVRESLFLD